MSYNFVSTYIAHLPPELLDRPIQHINEPSCVVASRFFSDNLDVAISEAVNGNALDIDMIEPMLDRILFMFRQGRFDIDYPEERAMMRLALKLQVLIAEFRGLSQEFDIELDEKDFFDREKLWAKQRWS